MRRFLAVALSVCGLLLVQTAAYAKDRIVFVDHWPVSDPFFNVIRNSAELAAKQLDVSIEFRNPPGGDISAMGRLITQAAASKPAGIISTAADLSVVEGPLTDAADQGIPVVIVNSGTPEITKKIGALIYIGQSEYEAGKEAGEMAKKAGVKSFVCVNHFYAQPVSHLRCQGFAAGLGVKVGDQEIDSGTDPNTITTRTAAFLRAHPDTQAILTLGPTSADPVITWLKDQGTAGKYFFATFDLDQDIVGAIKDGMIKEAVDQQPFIQGYDGVEVLVNYVRYGVIQANDIWSGPNLITKTNLGPVVASAGKYR
jgi:simple sugar transport system substrate-binding protein